MTALTPCTSPWRLRPELCRDVVWMASATEDAVLCLAYVDGQNWAVRLNSVDAPNFYALYINDQHLLDFDDWPGFWHWPT